MAERQVLVLVNTPCVEVRHADFVDSERQLRLCNVRRRRGDERVDAAEELGPRLGAEDGVGRSIRRQVEDRPDGLAQPLEGLARVLTNAPAVA